MMNVSWSAPSNIALVKYWGKKEELQIPANPSVSLTLSECKTTMNLTLGSSKEKKLVVLFEGKEKPSFIPKIEKFLSLITDELPFLRDYSLTIDSENTFPHSSGIASSASSMAALALCLVDVEQEILGNKHQDFFSRASYFARIGSGSAARSTFAHAASWGEYQGLGHDQRAHQVELHDQLKDLRNKILIIEKGEKKVSSTVGHSLMTNHPYAQARFKQAVSHWQQSLELLKRGNWDELGPIVEREAMALHAMMMTSSSSYMLMKPQTLSAMERIIAFREKTKVPVYFTLDAGPNIHMLYPTSCSVEVEQFFNDQLLELCQDRKFIDDKVGEGPVKNAV